MRNSIRLAIAAAFSAALLFVAAPTNAQSTAGCYGFDGHWATTWPGGSAPMHLYSSRGDFGYKNSVLTGQINGRVFYGAYAENDGSFGTFRLVLSPDGNSFHGWLQPNGDPGSRAKWSGICTGR